MKCYVDKFLKFARCLLELCSLAVFTPLGRLLRVASPKWRNIWLISERGFEARDNAWHLFRYLSSERPDINACFVIDRKSADLEKARNAGRVTYRSSVEHRLLMAAADRLVSTHIMGYTPDLGAYFRLDRLRLVPGIKVFLQHGITKDDMPFMHYPNTRCDLLVCAAADEHRFIKENFGHADGVAKLLGFCRYDALYRAKAPSKRQILFMPTWREWLALHDSGDFTHSDYFIAVNGFINSPRLTEILEKYDYTLSFYPHYEMHRFLNLFSSPSDRIKILGFGGNDVQALLIESSLLITDFSSVFFDFAYMRKPEVFYQFDEEEFRKRQYKEGYFSYRRDSFGKVATSCDSVLDEIERILESGCELSEEYARRADKFFTTRDDRNCERNYNAIKAIEHRME